MSSVTNMNGILVICFVLATALVVIAGTCDPAKCAGKIPQQGKNREESCKDLLAYMDCQEKVIADCNLDESLLEPFKKMKSESGCSSAGGLALSITCLFLSVLLGRMIN